MSASAEELVRSIAAAITAAGYDDLLMKRPGPHVEAPAAPTPPAGQATAFLNRLTLSDVLDDSILAAQSGDRSFPLRLLFASVAEHAVKDGDPSADSAWNLACALNVFFRVAVDEEVKLRLGLVASNLYYAFVLEQLADKDLAAQASPLLASLLSHELSRVRFESVDHQKVFDSQVHEREEGADGGRAAITRPTTFLCRVVATNMVRVRARVMT